MKPASSEASSSAARAMSSGWPMRPSGIVAAEAAISASLLP